MRQSIRALGWTITISMLVLLTFLVTAVYSAVQTVFMDQGIRLNDPQPTLSGDKMILSVPVEVNNTGWYDITDFRITTTLKDWRGIALAANTTSIEEVKSGAFRQVVHEFSVGFGDILLDMTYIMFNDTEFKIDMSVGFKYAYALGFQRTATNMSVPWGAPLYGFEVTGIGQPVANGSHLLMPVAVYVENHSFLDIAGDLNLKFYNSLGRYVGSGKGPFHVLPGSRLNRPIDVAVSVDKPADFTGKGYAEVFLELPRIGVSFELMRVDYG